MQCHAVPVGPAGRGKDPSFGGSVVGAGRRCRSMVASLPGPLGPEAAERLLLRAGFGPRSGEAHQLAALGLDRAIATLPPRTCFALGAALAPLGLACAELRADTEKGVPRSHLSRPFIRVSASSACRRQHWTTTTLVIRRTGKARKQIRFAQLCHPAPPPRRRSGSTPARLTRSRAPSPTTASPRWSRRPQSPGNRACSWLRYIRARGASARLGERQLCKLEVIGSIPIRSIREALLGRAQAARNLTATSASNTTNHVRMISRTAVGFASSACPQSASNPSVASAPARRIRAGIDQARA